MTNFSSLKNKVCDEIQAINTYDDLLNFFSKYPDDIDILKSFSKEICLYCKERKTDNCNGDCEKYCTWIYEEKEKSL